MDILNNKSFMVGMTLLVPSPRGGFDLLQLVTRGRKPKTADKVHLRKRDIPTLLRQLADGPPRVNIDLDHLLAYSFPFVVANALVCQMTCVQTHTRHYDHLEDDPPHQIIVPKEELIASLEWALKFKKGK